MLFQILKKATRLLYEIAKEILSAFVVSFGDDFKHRVRVKLALEQTDALIEFLKEK